MNEDNEPLYLCRLCGIYFKYSTYPPVKVRGMQIPDDFLICKSCANLKDEEINNIIDNALGKNFIRINK